MDISDTYRDLEISPAAQYGGSALQLQYETLCGMFEENSSFHDSILQVSRQFKNLRGRFDLKSMINAVLEDLAVLMVCPGQSNLSGDYRKVLENILSAHSKKPDRKSGLHIIDLPSDGSAKRPERTLKLPIVQFHLIPR